MCLIDPRVNLVRGMIETRDRPEAECGRISTAAPHRALQARWAGECRQGVMAGHIVVLRHVSETSEIRKALRQRGCGCRRSWCRIGTRMHENPHSDHDTGD